MSKNSREYPPCFSVLDEVFPMGDDGLRETSERCFVCVYKTECLRTAMSKSEGLKVREEKVDRAYDSGMISFLERWSKKKSLQRKIEQKKK